MQTPGVPWRSDVVWTPLSLPRRTLRVESWLVLPSLLVVLIAACGSPSADDGSRSDGSNGSSGSLRPPGQHGGRRERRPTAPSETATLGRGRVGLPDPGLTPGATNPAVTPDDLATTICRSGWSKSVRPPVSYTGTLKRTQIRQYGYEDRDASHYQEDHLIPLSIGGAPRDRRTCGRSRWHGDPARRDRGRRRDQGPFRAPPPRRGVRRHRSRCGPPSARWPATGSPAGRPPAGRDRRPQPQPSRVTAAATDRSRPDMLNR